MDSDVTTAELAPDEEYSGDTGSPRNLCGDRKQQTMRQPTIPPSVRVLCSTCAQPRLESEWNFSIEDGVATNNNSSSFKRGDLMKDKAGKGQKMRRNKGRVFYHRQPRTVLLSP